MEFAETRDARPQLAPRQPLEPTPKRLNQRLPRRGMILFKLSLGRGPADMGKPYADHLRLVVIRPIAEGHVRPELAELCRISFEFSRPLHQTMSHHRFRQSGQVRRLQRLRFGQLSRLERWGWRRGWRSVPVSWRGNSPWKV
jgi:hypothetical protein